jgi:Glu-tRNA(Gln) amidotransferase subunit E-like FAD-binding protein
MKIKRSVDIEDETRIALQDYLTVYCRPLPADYMLPNVLVTQVGVSDLNAIDTFDVVLDARAETEQEASETLRTAIGVLKAVAAAQTTAIRHVSVNTGGSWGGDPVRPDLSLCTARLRVVAHLETMEV